MRCSDKYWIACDPADGPSVGRVSIVFRDDDGALKTITMSIDEARQLGSDIKGALGD